MSGRCCLVTYSIFILDANDKNARLVFHSIQLNQNQQILIEHLWSEVPDIITATTKKEAAHLFFSRRLHSTWNNNYYRLDFTGSRLWQRDFCAGCLLTKKKKKQDYPAVTRTHHPNKWGTLKLGWHLEWSNFKLSLSIPSIVSHLIGATLEKEVWSWARKLCMSRGKGQNRNELPTLHPEALRMSHTLLKGDLDSATWPPPPQWLIFT